MLRLLIALPFAIGICFGLFSVMALMVDNGHHRAVEPSESLRFDMVMVENEQTSQRRQRSVPEQPKAPEPPPESQISQAQSEVASVTPLTSMPSLGLDTGVSGLAINAPTFSDFGSNQQAMPLYRVEPRYPSSALRQGAEGYVVMSFTIDPTGRAVDVKVEQANPRRLFEREAIRALRKWKYQPKVVEGKAIAQLGQTVRLEFKLAQ